MSGDHDFPDSNLLAITKPLDVRHGWDGSSSCKLRVAFADPAVAQHFCAPLARFHSRAAHALQFSDSASVIKMDV